MKCLMFTGVCWEAVECFNKWAVDKPLTKDMIIHSHVYTDIREGIPTDLVVIVVFFDEKIHTNW